MRRGIRALLIVTLAAQVSYGAPQQQQYSYEAPSSYSQPATYGGSGSSSNAQYPRGRRVVSKRQVAYGRQAPAQSYGSNSNNNNYDAGSSSSSYGGNSYGSNSYSSYGDSINVDVKFGQCNMRRQRTVGSWR